MGLVDVIMNFPFAFVKLQGGANTNVPLLVVVNLSLPDDYVVCV